LFTFCVFRSPLPPSPWTVHWNCQNWKIEASLQKKERIIYRVLNCIINSVCEHEMIVLDRH
jgi:hypothetical protein